MKKGGDNLREGDVVAGKYRILQALGKGGEGSVWLAVHLQTEQFWAVKEIQRKTDGREFHEINMMKKLRHPSLPMILDVLEGDSCIYLVMEYVRGHTLEEIKQKKGRFTPEQVMEVGLQLCNVLCYLHGRKNPVFHLDVKPANIIQKKDGTLVLVDFGSSWKLYGEDKEVQRQGTNGFAAPEQYDLNRPLDGRTDIYGLGATLYYLISGVRYSSTLQKSKIPGCPEYMSEVIRTCIQEKPEKRYQDSRVLRREMIKLRKSYQSGKQRIKIWVALLLAILTVGIALRELPAEFTVQVEENWDYEKLLAEALCTAGEESLAYYERALFCAPEGKQAYLQYLEQAGSDGILTKKEEEQFRSMLHTIPLGKSETYEELLAANPEAYGEIAFRLGMLYWFGYEGEEGRRIAAGWFGKMEAALGKLPENRERKEWELRAELFGHVSTYFERLGRGDETEDSQNLELRYWEDLKQILALQEEQEYAVTELQFFRETLNQVIFLSEELYQAGISAAEQIGVVDQIAAKVQKRMTEEQREGIELEQEIIALAGTAKTVMEHLLKTEEGIL